MNASGDKQSPDLGAPVELNQRQLLARHLAGDPQAFAELMTQFQAPVFGYLVRCGVDPASREDLFQDVFLKIHRAAATYRPAQPLKPWIFTIAANTVRSHYRARRVREIVMHENRADHRADPGPSPDQQREAAETGQVLAHALARLSLVQREVILLCCVEQLDQQDAARSLGLPVNTLKTHLRRARLSLAQAICRHRLRVESEVAS